MEGGSEMRVFSPLLGIDVGPKKMQEKLTLFKIDAPHVVRPIHTMVCTLQPLWVDALMHNVS